jgi:hypothetical protein
VGTEGLIAALPVLLGFRPRDSLVVVSTGGPGGRRVGLTLRVDLPPINDPDDPDDPDLVEALCRSAAQAIARDAPNGAAVVVVGGAGPVAVGGGRAVGGAGPVGGAGAGAEPGPGVEAPGFPPPRTDVAAAAVSALVEAGVGVHTVAWAAEIEAGAPWRCYPFQGCGCEGVLPDPTGTVLAATAASRGTVVYPSREELARVVEPVAEPPRAVQPRAVDDSGSTPGWPDDPIQTLHRALDAAAAGRLVVDAELVRIMKDALRAPRFRDIALTTCVGPDAAAAEQLWAALARTCRGPAAADPAALLAVCALARGDGALANLALERAEQIRPRHRLTRDLRTALAAGWGPTEVRTWLEGEL